MSNPTITEINKDAFWELIAQAKAHCGQDQDAYAQWLVDRLTALGPEQTLHFDKTAETELHELTHGAEQARQDYAQLMSWAGVYDKCTFEAKKMNAAQFIKTVHIKRDYEIEIEFNVAFMEFQKIYLEPEPEESRRKRSATTILALAETAGQAV